MMDSKQTPQQRIEQDGKVYEWTGERRKPKDGEYFLGEDSSRGIICCAVFDFACEEKFIYREAPAELAQASEEARPTAEQVVNGEEVVKASEPTQLEAEAASDTLEPSLPSSIAAEIRSLAGRIEDGILGVTAMHLASRDEELRRLREENERLRISNNRHRDACTIWEANRWDAAQMQDCLRSCRDLLTGCLSRERKANAAGVECFAVNLVCSHVESLLEQIAPFFDKQHTKDSVVSNLESQLAAANEQVEKLKGDLESKQRLMDVYVTMSREANDFYGRLHQAYRKGESNEEVTRLVRLLVDGWRTAESAVPNYAQLEAEVEALKGDLSHCEQLCGEACRALAQFRPQLSQQIIVRCKRAASGHITVPLTHSEAEKICAGEPVRQGEDLAAQVEKLQSENKLLSEQKKLAYNWLPRRDKEMFDQKYPKEVTV